MPLTPAEVHNVAFKKPPIGKRGYDEEEVDAFLDIVEVELSRLIEENNDLHARSNGGAPTEGFDHPGAQQGGEAGHDDGRLAAAEQELASTRDENQRMQAHIGELEHALSEGGHSGQGHGQPAGDGESAAQQQVAALQQQLAQTEQQLAESRQQLEGAQRSLHEAQAAQTAQAAQPAGEPGAAPTMEHHQQAVALLAMAQQTADQHLAQSQAEAERLRSEAQANHEQTINAAQQQAATHVSDAEGRASQLDQESTERAQRTVQEAEQRAATITAQFEQRKAALERRVEELRTFEREYRTRLKSYLESQLHDLDASGNTEPAQGRNMAEASQG